MDNSEIITTLRRHEVELHRQGVAHAAVFGSVARGEARPDSDIDILIDLDPDIPLSVFDYASLKEYIAGLFERPVDVVNTEGLKPFLRQQVRTETIYAF
jgi:predicted nucleotidyltransferase